MVYFIKLQKLINLVNYNDFQIFMKFSIRGDKVKDTVLENLVKK